MATTFRAIENADGSIQLHDLYNEATGKYYKEPTLTFIKADEENCWDNEDYVLNFFRGLKKNKKAQNKELKNFCKVNNLNLEETKEDLLDIYQQSKQSKFWKNGDNNMHK